MTCFLNAIVNWRWVNFAVVWPNIHSQQTSHSCPNEFSSRFIFESVETTAPSWAIFWVRNFNDVIMDKMASQITSLTIVYSTVYSDADQRKHQSSASLAFVWGIHRGPVNSPHKWPVTRKIFPFDDVIMKLHDAEMSSNLLHKFISGWSL